MDTNTGIALGKSEVAIVEWMSGRMVRWVDGQTVDGYMDGWVQKRMGRWMDGWWMGGYMVEWLGGWMDRQVGEMDR